MMKLIETPRFSESSEYNSEMETLVSNPRFCVSTKSFKNCLSTQLSLANRVFHPENILLRKYLRPRKQNSIRL